jgi:hypothetical protein
VSDLNLTLIEAARIVRDALRERRWGDTPIGEQVDAYLDALEYEDAARNTIDAYTHVLGLLAVEHPSFALADLEPPQGGGVVRAFLDRHWSDKSPATRRKRLAIVRSFLRWLVGEGLLAANPATNIKGPKLRGEERHAHSPARVRTLIYAQENERDRVCLMLLGWLGLRKNELRQLQVRHVDLIAGRIIVHGKGGTVNALPIGYKILHGALYALLADRNMSTCSTPEATQSVPWTRPQFTAGGRSVSSRPASSIFPCTSSVTRPRKRFMTRLEIPFLRKCFSATPTSRRRVATCTRRLSA